MPSSASRLLLLDSASLYFRAFYGVPERAPAPSGIATNAIAGFIDMLATLVGRYSPTHLAACWDDDWRPQWRVDAIPSYKAHRVAEDPGEGEEVPDALAPQVPVIADCLEVLGVPRVGAATYEADDVIGTLAHHYRGRMPVDIVTGDRDLFQLVDDASQTRVVYTARGGVRDPDLVDETYLQERYGIATGDLYADMAVLRGDTSDGLPGVAGIGEKTAVRLLAAHGSLGGIRDAIASGDPTIRGAQRARLEAGAAYLDAAPRVVRVALDVPVTDHDLTIGAELPDPAGMSRLALEHAVAGPLGRAAAALYPAG